MISTPIKFLPIVVFGVFCAMCVNAAPSLFSNYGQIQNVQNYSTNPFWTPNSPYNQKLPQPVYVQGADLKAEDCINVVQPLIYVQCTARNNCQDTKLSDIRPTIMVQLSNLPGNNYVSACAGFIDGIFESYIEQNANAITKQVAFPTQTVPNQNINTGNNVIQNPYKQQTPQWQAEINQRASELERLQAQNAAKYE